MFTPRIYIIVWTFFWNQSFISKNTHFEMSILTQISFSSNLMASGTLDKSSWPSQIPIVCCLGKGSPMPETHIAPNHTPTIADFVPKWLNTPTLYTLYWLASSFYGLWTLLGSRRVSAFGRWKQDLHGARVDHRPEEASLLQD